MKGTSAYPLTAEKAKPDRGNEERTNRIVAELQKEVEAIYEDKERQLSMTSSSERKKRVTA